MKLRPSGSVGRRRSRIAPIRQAGPPRHSLAAPVRQIRPLSKPFQHSWAAHIRHTRPLSKPLRHSMAAPVRQAGPHTIPSGAFAETLLRTASRSADRERGSSLPLLRRPGESVPDACLLPRLPPAPLPLRHLCAPLGHEIAHGRNHPCFFRHNMLELV